MVAFGLLTGEFGYALKSCFETIKRQYTNTQKKKCSVKMKLNLILLLILYNKILYIV